MLRRYIVFPQKNIIYSEKLNKKDIDDVISDYLKNNYVRNEHTLGKPTFEAHKIYGINCLLNYKYVYIDYNIMVFDFKNEKKSLTLENYDDYIIAGPQGDIIIVLKQDKQGNYSVINDKKTIFGNGIEDYPWTYNLLVPSKFRKNKSLKESFKTSIQLQENVLNQTNQYVKLHLKK